MDRYSEYRRLARQLDVDAVAIVPGSNFARMTGRSFGTNERPLVIVIPQEGLPAAVVPNLELRSFDLLNFEGEVFDWRDQDGYQHAFDAFARHMPLSSLAVEGQVMRVFVHHALAKAYGDLRIIDGETEISGLRIIKTADDVERIVAAIRLSELALEDLLQQVRIGMTEKQIEGLLVQALFRHGAEALAFTPIVAAAANSARPHASARSDYAVQAGDALLLDFGARRGGFVSDITRTVFVGHATDEARDVYDTVLRANLKGHEVTRAGVTAHQIDDAVIGVLEASPYANRIRTKTGHGMGREVHEQPYIMRGNQQVMQAGMVFTNEPGLYEIGNFGVRIEDDILVTEDGCRSLTRFPKDLRVVG
jgi:Xaa-Pro dipeptidase